ncbi:MULTISPECIES: BglG family transcription antiterminator [Salibacterium]|uniref:Ascorbate-specific PTS system EIIA component n=2 Tax=Salibacterium TaxID=1884429 RepID=A0A1I4PJT2_9BACI|nr:BglG family transcription antiterminator [Salibacterium qingdaonense]SFM27765.1 transcriptional antiterminator, BglG family [Salibacterium qingdaonense]
MQLDQRSSDLLNELAANPGLNSKDLEVKYNLNRRQLKYSFDKINGWLKTKNLPCIERTRQGLFLIDPVVSSTLFGGETKEQQEDNVLSEKEREDILLLLLLGGPEELSLIHFTSALDVSKNTALNDLKKVQERLAPYDVTVTYSRRTGYELEGKEFAIRQVLLHTVARIMGHSGAKGRFLETTELHEEEITFFQEVIQDIEHSLQLKFTDEKMESMPYVLSLLLRRVSQGHCIDSFYIHYEEVMDTKEWKATEKILEGRAEVPVEERLFITLHLLTANVYWAQDLTEDAIPDLLTALEDMVRLFETYSCIHLHNKEQLLHRLMLHVKPAYYRVKYKLTDINEWELGISEEFQELHHLVKQSTGPLETLIGEPMPDNETTYITMLIGGWLTRQGDSIHSKTKALVVCPHGVSVSRLLFGELRDVFPELVFLDALSVRDFQKYELEYDVVFSPVFVQTKATLFLVSKMLDPDEKKRLRRQVMSELHGYTPEHLSVETMLDIVHKHAHVSDEDALQQELEKYVHRDSGSADADPAVQRKPQLYEMVTPERIRILPKAADWTGALQAAARPLVEEASITEEYVEAMLAQGQDDPYFILGNHVAIPHASPENGVQQMGMSLLKLEESVSFDDTHRAQFIFVIAAMDKHDHLQALRQIMKLSQNQSDIENLRNAATTDQIQTILQKYAF